MKLPRLPRRRNKELTTAQRSRKMLIETAFRYALVFMGAAALIYGTVSWFLGSSLFIPQNGKAVLESVKMPDYYGWTSEAVREVTLGGTKQKQDSVRSAVVDTKLNRHQLLVAGVFPERIAYISDGEATVRLTENGQQSSNLETSNLDSEGGAIERITDACGVTDDPSDDAALPTEAVSLPTVEDLLAANPQIDTDRGTVLGKQAWILDIDATPEIINKLLWIDYLDRASDAAPAEKPWTISEAERELIAAGDYETDYAKVWVNRDGQRMIQQIDLMIRIGFDEPEVPDSTYRLLGQLVPGVDREDTSPLAETVVGRACPASEAADEARAESSE